MRLGGGPTTTTTNFRSAILVREIYTPTTPPSVVLLIGEIARDVATFRSGLVVGEIAALYTNHLAARQRCLHVPPVGTDKSAIDGNDARQTMLHAIIAAIADEVVHPRRQKCMGRHTQTDAMVGGLELVRQ